MAAVRFNCWSALPALIISTWATTGVAQDNNWNIEASINWTNSANNDMTNFDNGNSVTFNDSGAANSPVILQGARLRPRPSR